jgi:D-alanine-D-alanine ligase
MSELLDGPGAVAATPSASGGTGLRVGILFNDDRNLAQGSADDAVAVESVASCADAVAEACRENGWEATRIACPRDPRALLERLADGQVDVVFNLVEALDGDARLEAALGWVLELARVPFTGAPPRAMQLALEKPVTRAVLTAAGVAVPKGRTLERGDEPLDGLTFPLIVKPAASDASHGIALESVCRTAAEVRARARHVRETYHQASVVEEYIDGRELNVSILGGEDACEVLPLAEIEFTAEYPAGKPRMVSYIAKWGTDADPEFKGSRTVPARELAGDLGDRVRSTALAAYRTIGLRDYGRVDIRLHPTLGPLVIDVNPNPDISPCAGLNIAADLAGLTYAQLIRRVVTAALSRAAATPSAR